MLTTKIVLVELFTVTPLVLSHTSLVVLYTLKKLLSIHLGGRGLGGIHATYIEKWQF